MGIGEFGEELLFKGVVDAFPEGGAAGRHRGDCGCIELAFWGRALISLIDRVIGIIFTFLWISRGGFWPLTVLVLY